MTVNFEPKNTEIGKSTAFELAVESVHSGADATKVATRLCEKIRYDRALLTPFGSFSGVHSQDYFHFEYGDFHGLT